MESKEHDFDDFHVRAVEGESSDDDVANMNIGNILSQAKHVTKAFDDPLSFNEKHSEKDKNSDILHFAGMTKWHPFMYLFHDCAASTHLDKAPGERMRSFSKDHPFFLKVCMVADFMFTFMCVVVTVFAMFYALAKLTGFVFPWEIGPCCKQICCL